MGWVAAGGPPKHGTEPPTSQATHNHKFKFILPPEMALQLASEADFWCNRRCKTNPIDLEGSRGQVLVVWDGLLKVLGWGGKIKFPLWPKAGSSSFQIVLEPEANTSATGIASTACPNDLREKPLIAGALQTYPGKPALQNARGAQNGARRTQIRLSAT